MGVYRDLNLVTKWQLWPFSKLEQGEKRQVGTEKANTFSEVLLPALLDSPSY